MNKLVLCATTFLFSIVAFASVASAQTITESPDVSILIDGAKGTYKDVTIIADGRTLLPLREVLVNLGVEDSDIVWDATKQSVTVKKGEKNIYLEVGKQTATVDGKDVTIDVAPIIYPANNRTYIPARFVAESLGKKVVWDADTRSVLIAEESNFNAVKELLEKSDEAMSMASKYKMALDMEIAASQGDMAMTYGIDIASSVDTTNKSLYTAISMDMLGIEMKMETYTKDNVVYSSYTPGEWTKTEMTSEEVEQSSNISMSINEDDYEKLAAGMIIKETENSNEVVISGNIFATSLLEGVASGMTSTEDIFSTLNMKEITMDIVYDKETYYIKGLTIKMEGEVEENGEVGTISVNAKADYTEYNGDFEIVVPQEVIDGATAPVLSEDLLDLEDVNMEL